VVPVRMSSRSSSGSASSAPQRSQATCSSRTGTVTWSVTRDVSPCRVERGVVAQVTTDAELALGRGVGDHLGQEPEDNELRADDHEQHAQRQKRPVADGVAQEPERGQVGVDAETDQQRDQAEPAEEVERAAPVLRQEQNRKQVEEATEEAGGSELGAAELSRAMPHLYLAHPESPEVGQHRDIAVQLTVEVDLVQDLGAVGLQAAVEVVELDPGHGPDHAVEDGRRQALAGWVVARVLPAAHQVGALLQRREQVRDLRRYVLEVGVQGYDGVATRRGEPGGERGGLAEVASELDHLHALV